MKILFIGGGYASCCTARLLLDQGHEVHIFERSPSLGGMAKSYQIEGMTYEFGPHILANHADDQKVIEFILKYIEVIPTTMETSTYLQGQHLNYPPHISDVTKLSQQAKIEKELQSLPSKIDETNFETYLISKVGKTLYELYFKYFTEKFWMVNPASLSADWAKLRHLGESLTEKQMFFNKKWCAYPKNDFNELFDNISAGFNLHLRTNITEIDGEKSRIVDDNGNSYQGDMLVSTISIDTLFNNKFGELDYRGYRIEPKVLYQHSFHPIDPETGKNYSMVYYPEKETLYTRTTEYKWFNHKATEAAYQGKTVITIETPSDKLRFYPMMSPANEQKLAKYLNLLSKSPKLVSIGRMGLYKYTTLDTTTQQVFRFMEKFASWNEMSPEERFKAYHYIRGDWHN